MLITLAAPPVKGTTRGALERIANKLQRKKNCSGEVIKINAAETVLLRLQLSFGRREE